VLEEIMWLNGSRTKVGGTNIHQFVQMVAKVRKGGKR